MSVPEHIALIPDGNRRWAKERGLLPHEGHMAGFERARDIIGAAYDAGVRCVTLWAASADNLTKRSPVEVKFLAKIVKEKLASDDFINDMERHDSSLSFIGRWSEILHDADLAAAVAKIEERTARFTKRRGTILFGYDGREEMTAAVRKIAARGHGGEAIDREAVRAALWTGGLPPVDLVIRTGEREPGWTHWSAGFMMWQAANAEIYSTKNYWPDFTPDELNEVLKKFSERERRFGK